MSTSKYKPSERQKKCRFALPYQGEKFEHTYCLNGKKTLGDLNNDCEVSNDIKDISNVDIENTWYDM